MDQIRGNWRFKGQANQVGNIELLVEDPGEEIAKIDGTDLIDGLKDQAQRVGNGTFGRLVFSTSPHRHWFSSFSALIHQPPVWLKLSENVVIEFPPVIGRPDAARFHQAVLKLASRATTRMHESRSGSVRMSCEGTTTSPGPQTMSAGCTFAGEQSELASLRRKPPVACYRPDYLRRGWKPERVPHLALWQMAKAQLLGSRARLLNDTCSHYLLPNQLVEGEYNLDLGTGYFGIITVTEQHYFSTLAPSVNRLLGTNYSRDEMTRLAQNGQGTFDFVLTTEEALVMGAVYALIFEDKTGAYATKVHGPSATTDQRLALWNGVGRAKTRIGQADAGGHAKKVRAMNAELAESANAELVQWFQSYGGVIHPEVPDRRGGPQKR